MEEVKSYLAKKFVSVEDIIIESKGITLGTVDIVTSDFFIQVKDVKEWMEGKGQIETYSEFIDGRRKALCLYGEVDINTYLFIQKHLLDRDIFLIPVNLKVGDYTFEPIPKQETKYSPSRSGTYHRKHKS